MEDISQYFFIFEIDQYFAELTDCSLNVFIKCLEIFAQKMQEIIEIEHSVQVVNFFIKYLSCKHILQL